LADPQAVLQQRFGPNALGYRSIIDPGRLEADDFIINDVPLRIPPEQIVIQKESFNQEWNTLRTRSSKKAKSGYGLARVSFSLIFKVSDPEDNDNLRRVVAGLRATPFCVVYNRYLDRILGRPDDDTPVASGTETSQQPAFQPIMLAMASMSFTTCGHEGKPDCVRASFDFIWFNYLPYTNFIAFKAGATYDKPGFPWECPLWEAFYSPFLTIPVNFPHYEGSAARITEFMWREFLLIPQGTPAAIEAAKDLAEAIQKKPKEISAILEDIIQQGTRNNEFERADTRNPDIINEGILDTLYRRALKKGLIDPSTPDFLYKDGRDSVLPPGIITQAAGGILTPVLRQHYGTDQVSARAKDSADMAVAILTQRLRKIQSIQKRGDITFSGLEGGSFTELLNTDADYGSSGSSKTSAGGLRLFGRKRIHRISHNTPGEDFDNNSVIQQIVVSFKNILATIPMLAYRYPTVQHVGSIDAEVNLVINAKNTGAEAIRRMYDRVETMALRYKQVPAGYTNLNIQNDFLQMFGLSEFLPERLEINTIPDQPSRSMVNLTLADAGLTSDDIDPEEIQQEFVQSHPSIFKQIYSTLEKNTTLTGGHRPGKGVGFFTTIFTNGRADVQQDTEGDYYKLRVINTKITGADQAYATLVAEAVNVYNELSENVHEAIFNEGTVEGSVNYAAIYSVEENDSKYGYVPGINKIKRGIELRNKAYRREREHKKTRSANFNSQKKLDKEKQANSKAKLITGNAAITAKTQSEAERNIAIRIADMGLTSYITTMRALFTKIQQQYKTLEQFQFIIEQERNLGLSQGLLAYADFAAQIKNVADLVEGPNTNRNNTSLMKYDPDCYFYYPFLHGGSSSPLFNVVDPYYISVAQVHSKNIMDNAKDRIDEYFKNTYLPKLNNDANPIPYKILTKKYGNSSLAETFYKRDGSFTNSTHSESISNTIVPDSESKSPSNWYFNGLNNQIKSNNVCVHSTDINDLWGGVGQSAGGASLPSSNSPSSTAAPTYSKGKGKQKWLTVESPELVGNKRYEHLNELRLEMQPIVERILDEMVAKGYDPVINQGYRTIADQREKVLNGYSQPSVTRIAKNYLDQGILPIGTSLREARQYIIERGIVELRVGYHTWGLAVDIKPRGYNWKSADPKTAEFLRVLREIASKNGLECGGWWKKRNVWKKYGLGWDPWHCQLTKFNDRPIPDDWKQDIMAERRAQQANAQRFEPPGPVQKRLEQKKAASVNRDVTSTLSSPLGQAINEFERDLYNGQAQSMLRAYPAFKLYFIEDDSEDRKRLQFDDFFSYHSVQSIRVIRSRKIAADLCEIYITNISGVLSNRKFRNSRKSDSPHANGRISEETTTAMRGGTSEENPIASLLLQEGMNIHLRMGYCNDPDRLETVFNGAITEVQFSESDDLVRIVAQSYAVELVQDIKGVQKPQDKSSYGVLGWDFWGIGSNATTGRILEEMMAQPEVLHFGRWDPKAGGDNSARELLTQRWTFQPQPQDDNIFAPSHKQDLALSDGNFFNNLKYIIYRTTIWDIFQEMTLRHPNFIASPVPYKGKYGERMTMFYGLPNQLYFSRDPSVNEELADAKLKNIQETAERDLSTKEKYEIKKQALIKFLKENNKKHATNSKTPYLSTDEEVKRKAEDILAKRSGRGLGVLGRLNNNVRTVDQEKIIENAVTGFYKERRLREAKQAGYVSPFRNYHLVTSSQHIVQNNIKANARDVANTIVIKYGGEVEVKDNASGENLSGIAIKGDEEEFVLKIDNALPTEETRTQMGQFVNVTNPELAKRYALGLLLRNIKDIYKGELVIVGNPKIKPYDVVYMFDEYTDMTGAFEVEEVQHIFDQQHGFRTEIKPDMLAQASEFSLLGSAEALGIVMEGALRKLGDNNNSMLKFFAPNPYIMGHGINMFGGFLAEKLINYTQLAQPIIMSPLLHQGRLFTGGVPVRKLPGSNWTTAFGNWSSKGDEGYQDWKEDLSDTLLGWIKKNTGQFAVGNFFNRWGDTPE
jgi:hypothetical protein